MVSFLFKWHFLRAVQLLPFSFPLSVPITPSFSSTATLSHCLRMPSPDLTLSGRMRNRHLSEGQRWMDDFAFRGTARARGHHEVAGIEGGRRRRVEGP